jgi:hypothetical protein
VLGVTLKSLHFLHVYTRWFKYDRDKLWLVYTQIVPVIFEPPCILQMINTRDIYHSPLQHSQTGLFDGAHCSVWGRYSVFTLIFITHALYSSSPTCYCYQRDKWVKPGERPKSKCFSGMKKHLIVKYVLPLF